MHNNYPHPAWAAQHLAYLRQQQTPGVRNPWAAEAALEAHIQQGMERQQVDLPK
jgi:hypothetical protein